MKFDIYKIKGECLVYERGGICEDGFLPECDPLYKSSNFDDCFEWCKIRVNWHVELKGIRVCESVGTYKADFAEDLKNLVQMKLDQLREEGESMGFGKLEIDHSGIYYTFRANADWKNESIKYTFNQPLKWTNSVQSEMQKFVAVRMAELRGMSMAAHELGIGIVFDDDFKVHIYGVRKMWETHYEY